MKPKKKASVAAQIIQGLSEFADALEKGHMPKLKRRKVTKRRRRR